MPAKTQHLTAGNPGVLHPSRSLSPQVPSQTAKPEPTAFSTAERRRASSQKGGWLHHHPRAGPWGVPRVAFCIVACAGRAAAPSLDIDRWLLIPLGGECRAQGKEGFYLCPGWCRAALGPCEGGHCHQLLRGSSQRDLQFCPSGMKGAKEMLWPYAKDK